MIGVAGLALTSIGWETGATGRAWMMDSGQIGAMHTWMHGSVETGATAPAPSPGADEIRVAAREFSFSPSEVSVASGRTVNVTLVNEGDLQHDITIPALGFHLAAAPGVTVSGALTVAGSGKFEFFCSIPGHRDSGMSGTLVAG